MSPLNALPPTRGADFWTFFAAAFGALVLGLASLGAALALVSFFVFLTSLAARMASSRCAFLSSGFWLRLARISLRDAPTMARWNLWVRRVFFLVVSSSTPLRCLRRYSTVQVTLRGLRFSRCAFLERPSRKRKVFPSALMKVIPLDG